MQNEDDIRGLAKTAEFMRAISILFLILHLYWFCFDFFFHYGCYHEVVNKILTGFQKNAGLFSSPLNTKLFSLLFLVLSNLGIQGVKDEKIKWKHILYCLLPGLLLFWGNFFILDISISKDIRFYLYFTTLAGGYILMLVAGIWITRILKTDLMNDVFNDENESFMQEQRLLENEYSVNLKTRFRYKGKWLNGYISVVNCFRSSAVLGLPGSGKSYTFINSFIKQHIQKGFAMYIYDFKFDDLSIIAYNTLLKHMDNYKVKPQFYVINFDDPRRSHRCNPLSPKHMTNISDAYEASFTIMLNLNKTWIQKSGDFFVESPIILFAAIIWFLKLYQEGKYCTFPHAIELLNKSYADIFMILRSYRELENYLSPFQDAMEAGAQDQLQGQLASAKIPLSRMISPQLYYVMTGDDFTLDINNPNEPKILCVGNNPDRQNIYSAALGLYNSRIVKLINKKGQLKCSVIIDELPTIYFRGLDNLIATARSNKVSVCVGFQDFSQLTRDYGDKEAKSIINLFGNIFSGQVVGETAKNLSERFGRIVQRRQSLSINRQDTSSSINTQLDTLIPASKISTLTQGFFVGAVADNFDERIEQKVFHAEIVIDNEAVAEETKNYQPIPIINDFTDEEGNDIMEEQIERNYYKIKQDINQLILDELERIKKDPSLKHLLPPEPPKENTNNQKT